MTDFDSELLLDKLIGEAARRGELQGELSRAREQMPRLVQAMNELEERERDAARLLQEMRKILDGRQKHRAELLQVLEGLRVASAEYLGWVHRHPRGRMEEREKLARKLDQHLKTVREIFDAEIPF